MSLSLNALFRKYATTQANLDSQEFQTNQAAETNRKSRTETLAKDEKNLSDIMATKGMTHSGVNLSANTSLKKAYGENSGRADQEQARMLTEIAKKRLDAESDFQSAKAYDPIRQLVETLKEK